MYVDLIRINVVTAYVVQSTLKTTLDNPLGLIKLLSIFFQTTLFLAFMLKPYPRRMTTSKQLSSTTLYAVTERQVWGTQIRSLCSSKLSLSTKTFQALFTEARISSTPPLSTGASFHATMSFGAKYCEYCVQSHQITDLALLHPFDSCLVSTHESPQYSLF